MCAAAELKKSRDDHVAALNQHLAPEATAHEGMEDLKRDHAREMDACEARAASARRLGKYGGSAGVPYVAIAAARAAHESSLKAARAEHEASLAELRTRLERQGSAHTCAPASDLPLFRAALAFAQAPARRERQPHAGDH